MKRTFYKLAKVYCDFDVKSSKKHAIFVQLMNCIKAPLVLFFCIASIFGFGQVNIVSNSGFELTSCCPNFGAGWSCSNGWNNVNMNLGPGGWGTPDFFHACGTAGAAPPSTFSGTCTPQAGVAMMGLVMYNVPYPQYREYLSTPLACPMTPGNTYTVSFWITNGTGIKSPYSIRNIGIHFSATPLTQTGWNLINVVPQCEITTNVATTSWVQYTFAVTPTATWNHLTLGCFRPDASNNPTLAFPNPGGPASVYANYFFDNVQVIAPPSSGNTIPMTASVTQPNGCGGTGSATVSAITGGMTTYSWFPGNFSGPTASNLAPGVYTVLASNSSSCSSSTGSTQFTINPATSLTVSVNSPVACPNQTIQMSAIVNGGIPAYSYTWMPGNVTTPNMIVNSSVNNTYTLIVADNTGCIGSSVITPSVSNVQSNFNFTVNPCNGSVWMSNTSTNATSFNWDFGDGTSSLASNTNHIYTNAGTYSITLTSSNGTCSDVITKTISVSSPVQSNFNAQITMCDSVVTLSNFSLGGITYSWNFGDGTTSNLSNPSPHVYSAGGNYTLWLVVGGQNGCKDSVSKTVTVVKNAQANFNALISSCSPVVNFSNISISNLNNFWNFGDGNYSNLSSPQHTYSSSGTYTVTLTINAGTTCSATIFKTVKIGDTPEAAFQYTPSICNTLVKFKNISGDTSSCSWIFGDGHTSQSIHPTHYFPSAGTYIVKLITLPNTLCSDTLKHSIILQSESVIADFDSKKLELTYDVQFINLSKNATIFKWDFGDGVISSKYEPIHEFEKPGEHNVCMMAMNSNGCSDTICKKTTIEADWTFYIPNSFSPNEDGKNDVFFAYANNISNFKIRIFDRWGEQLFFSSQIENGWNGIYKGEMVKSDVYVWQVEFQDSKKKIHKKTGHVQVLK